MDTVKLPLCWFLHWMLSWHLNTMSVAELIHLSSISVTYISAGSLAQPSNKYIAKDRLCSIFATMICINVWQSSGNKIYDRFTFTFKGRPCFLRVSFICFTGVVWSEDRDARFWWHQDDNASTQVTVNSTRLQKTLHLHWESQSRHNCYYYLFPLWYIWWPNKIWPTIFPQKAA